MLDWSKFDGNKWEKLCDHCYRIRYQSEHYQKIPAIEGDCGIEGYTHSGVVYQCYFPERKYTDSQLYNHLRDKMTEDIAKLLNDKNIRKLKDLLPCTIREWHFVTPDYKDQKILKHAKTKKEEVLKTKKNDTLNKYDHIDDEFRIIIKVADDFSAEIARVIKNEIIGEKIKFDVAEVKTDWQKCDSQKVANIERKVMAILIDGTDERRERVIELFIKNYLDGLLVMEEMRNKHPDIYDSLHSLEEGYKRKISLETQINSGNSENKKIFNKILDDFGAILAKEYPELDFTAIVRLNHDLVATWLADCPMEFF